jgi:hypothetical protein
LCLGAERAATEKSAHIFLVLLPFAGFALRDPQDLFVPRNKSGDDFIAVVLPASQGNRNSVPLLRAWTARRSFCLEPRQMMVTMGLRIVFASFSMRREDVFVRRF